VSVAVPRRGLAPWWTRPGLVAISAAAIAAVFSNGGMALASPARTEPALAKTACSLLAHSQVTVLIDASHFSVTISAPDHCSWDVAGNTPTSNGVQIIIGTVNAGNTLIGRSGAALAEAIGCTGYAVKKVPTVGELGYYCVIPLAISGANLYIQKGSTRAGLNIGYGLPGDKVNVPDLVSDAELLIKEVTA
jgi:hypothetical protein